MCFTISYMFFTYFNFYIISAHADHSLMFLLYKPGYRLSTTTKWLSSMKDRQKDGQRDGQEGKKKGQEKQ